MSISLQRWSALAISAVLLALVATADATDADDEPTDPIRKDGRLQFIGPRQTVLATIDVEIADTPPAQTKGLMHRRYFDDTMGMLFIYDRADRRAFWMRNTHIPLDIVFVSEDRRILNIARQTDPLSDTHYISRGAAKYVVEVLAGFCDRHGIGRGSMIKWQRH